ncbi:MAG TPA: hypothetical protein VNB23_17060 [Ramlibacter sp.]|nr:hypothetical protein [Ramlibacter sp.]
MSVPPPGDTPTYPSGRPIRAGDRVIFDGGARGRVREVLAAPEAAAQGYSGAGAVVDAPPLGDVFLTADLLREEPVRLFGRGAGAGIRVTLSFAIVLAALLALPAFYSLLSALWHAWFTGEVLVISLGKTDTHTQLVPWPRGWARFVGPPLLLLSLSAYDGSHGATLRWWAAGVGTATALVLLGFSFWFSSVQGTLAFVLFSTWIGAVWAIAHRLGRPAAYLFIVLSAASFFWRLATMRGMF